MTALKIIIEQKITLGKRRKKRTSKITTTKFVIKITTEIILINKICFTLTTTKLNIARHELSYPRCNTRVKNKVMNMELMKTLSKNIKLKEYETTRITTTI
uniref:Uncharacterized protein n=1 Tax=Cacopsylla melanoneura TaxID=428564 RepID=A0A8D9F1T6_9HEMI